MAERYDYGGSMDGGGYGGSGGYDPNAERLYLEELRRQQEEEARRRMEEEARMRAEEEARMRAEEDARRAAEQQALNKPPSGPEPGSLGDLMRPPSPYDQGPPQEPPQLMPSSQQPPDMPMPAAGQPQQAGPPYRHDPNRDFSINPLTGAELEAYRAAGGNTHVQGATSYHGGSAFPTGTPTPDRDTSEMDLDEFNQAIRGSELYQQFIDQRGLRGQNGQVIEWSEGDRDAWRDVLRAQGVQIPDGMKVDNAGNLNQKNTLVKKVLIGAAIGGAALTGFGLAGMGPLAGLGGGAAAAGSGAAAAAGGSAAAGAGAAAGTAAAAGGAAAAGTAAAAGGAAAAAGAAGGAVAGASMMPHIITGLAGVGSTYLGARAQNNAANRAAESQERASADSSALVREQMAFEREQREIERQEGQRRWEAEQEMSRRMWEAQEDERLYRRQIFEEDRAARLGGGGGGFSAGPSGPSPQQLRKEQAQRALQNLLAQGTPGFSAGAPATAAGPTGRT